MKFAIEVTDRKDEYILSVSMDSVHNINKNELSEIFFDPSILPTVAHAKVTISGRAPLFIYMYLAIQLFEAKIKEIFVKSAQDEPVKIFPLKENTALVQTHLPVLTDLADRVFCEIPCSRNDMIDVSELTFIADSIPEPDRNKESIIFSGKIPVWLAAALAIAARQKGWQKVECFAPRMGGSIGVFPLISLGKNLPQLTEKGNIIGVIGDPNSGKSVFSKLLEKSGIVAGVNIWCYDCDYAAPTPNWYLDMLKKGDEAAGRDLRLSYKRKWIPGAEEELVNELRNIQQFIQFVIADLPGGRHESDFVQRIPTGREVLMEAVDYFIIIAREKENCDTGLAWHQELEKINKDQNIVLTLYSENPDGVIAISDRNGKTYISGLSRNADSVPEHIKIELWKRFANVINGNPMEIRTM